MSATSGYRYRAVRADGAIEAGHVEAESRATLADGLARRGLLAVSIEAQGPSNLDRPAIPADDLALGLRLLANLLRAGLPLHRALAAFTDTAPSAWRPLIPELHRAIREGRSLAAALAAAPANLPDVVLGIIEAGESGSGLADAVLRAAAVVESAARSRAQIRAALAYPCILAVASAASLSLLVGVVLPRFAVILADLGQQLPVTTRLVLAAGDHARRLALPAIVLGGAAALLLRALLRDPRRAETLGRALWSLPVVGPIRARLATARACDALAALAASGVPVVRGLARAARAAGDPAMAAALARAREAVIGGAALGAAIEAERAFTPTALRLLRAGEDTGRVAEMLAEGATIEREAAESAAKSAVRLIEPAMILLFGGLVALAAAALLQALYGIRPT